MIEDATLSLVKLETVNGVGSGIIFQTNLGDKSALILTAYHVVKGDSRITASYLSKSYQATIVGEDILRDLAVVRICCSLYFQSLPLGDTSDLRAGDEVIALGYVLGLEGPPTISRGIVSAVRYDKHLDLWEIQTDAPVNPGNSGGPLLSTSGDILGIVASKFSGVAIDGLGFAVSVRTINLVFDEFVAGKFVYATPSPVCPIPIASSNFQEYVHSLYSWRLQVPVAWEELEPYSGGGTEYKWSIIGFHGDNIVLEVLFYFGISGFISIDQWADTVVDYVRGGLPLDSQESVQVILSNDTDSAERVMHVQYEIDEVPYKIFALVKFAKGSAFAVLLDVPQETYWVYCQSLPAYILGSFAP
jgi:hypothetical protein